MLSKKNPNKQHFYRGKWKSQMTTMDCNGGKKKGLILLSTCFLPGPVLGYLHTYYIR